jgi:hypothetical protein
LYTGVTGIEYPVRPDQLQQTHPLKIPKRYELESRQSEDNACLRQILVQIHYSSTGTKIHAGNCAAIDDQPSYGRW